MAVNLRKGQKTGTSKTKRENLHHLIVDLTWSEEQRSFYGAGAQSIDCDVSAIACRSGRDGSAGDIIYFGHFSHIPGDIQQKSNDFIGTNIGQGERILVDLFSLPTEYEKIIFIFNIFKKKYTGNSLILYETLLSVSVMEIQVRNSANMNSLRIMTI